MKGYKKKKDYNSMIQRLDDAKKGVGMQDMLSQTTAADEPKMKKKKRKKKFRQPPINSTGRS